MPSHLNEPPLDRETESSRLIARSWISALRPVPTTDPVKCETTCLWGDHLQRESLYMIKARRASVALPSIVCAGGGTS